MNPNITMASGCNTNHRHLHGLDGNMTTDLNTDASCSRTIDPDMALGGSMNMNVIHCLGWLHRPLKSTRPPSGTQTNGYQDSLRQWPRLRTSICPFVVTQGKDINMAPGY